MYDNINNFFIAVADQDNFKVFQEYKAKGE